MPQDNRCCPPWYQISHNERTHMFWINSDLSCFSAPLARLIRCHKKALYPLAFHINAGFVFTCKYHYVTGESCIYIELRNCNLMASCGLHTCRVIVWIKCRRSGKCPVCGFVEALACSASKSKYHFYCRITCIASQTQSDFDFCN